jgi:hypothetical protein
MFARVMIISSRHARRVAQLRARIAAARVHAYKVAARVPMHPVRLSRILNYRDQLTRELFTRILHAIADEARARGGDDDAS